MSSKPNFPKDFYWGYATASAQVEGAVSDDGKGPSIWDTFSADPSHSEDGTSTEVATDFYNKFQEDIDLMKSYGVNSHRMSLSWSRIIPAGKAGSEVNEKGIQFYRKVIKALLDAGITPFVTLFHWDLPQPLQTAYKGFLSRDIVADFENYAKVCFERLGDLVQFWFTINEPNIYSLLGHCFGRHAPGRSSDRKLSPEGDSYSEPWIVGHNLLLSHAVTVKLYREQYAAKAYGGGAGKIGLVVNMNWGEPVDDDPKNVAAAERFMAEACSWFAEPLATGDYPEIVKKNRKEILPVFSDEEKAMLKGGTDFLAINHYTTYIIRYQDPAKIDKSDMWQTLLPEVAQSFIGKDGKEIAPAAGLSWVRPVPWGFGKLLKWAHQKFGYDIYISENGVVCPNENNLSREEAQNDDFRVNYLESYADTIAQSIQDGVPVKSYLMWAWTDNFEWQEGRTARFGVVWIDYEDGCKRYPKKSAGVMRDYFAKRLQA